MDSSSHNFSSFDPLTSFPTYIIQPFDNLNSPQQSLSSVSPDPLFSSLNFDSFESSDFNSSLGNSLSGYGFSLLNYSNSPPNEIITSQSKSPLSPYIYEPHNITTTLPTGMTFKSILDAIQGNISADSNIGRANPTAFSSSINLTPMTSVYTIIKLNEKETIPVNKNCNKAFTSTYCVNNLGNAINQAESTKISNEQQFHAYSKFTLLKKKPSSKKQCKDNLINSCISSIASKSDDSSPEQMNSMKALLSKKTSTSNNRKIIVEKSINKNNSLSKCDVVKVKNVKLRPVIKIKDDQLVKIDGKNRWKCDICDKSYTKKHNLVTHMFGHDGIKPFSCTTCGRCFKQLSHLNTHNLTHGSDKKYLCEVCKRSFVQSSHLRRHMKLHNKKFFPCTICKEEFTTFKDLHQHYAFVICKRVNVDKRKLGKFSCNECNKSFLHKSHLRIHSNNVHSNVRLFICTECGQEFNREHHLKYHLLTHSGVQPFSCVICLKRFSQKSNLFRHKLTHSSEKRYKCTICLQSYKHQQALNVHSVKHRTTLPFKCQHCNKSFSRRHSMNAHINLHKDTKQHTCVCGAAFTLKCNLYRHQKDKNCHKRFKNNPKSSQLDYSLDVLVGEGDQANESLIIESDQNHDVNDQINKSTPKKKKVPTATLR